MLEIDSCMLNWGLEKLYWWKGKGISIRQILAIRKVYILNESGATFVSSKENVSFKWF